MTLKNITHFDQIEIPEIPPLPTDHPAWSSLSEPTRSLCARYVDLAEKARVIAIAYRELWTEAEALRAERDALLARLSGQPVTAH